MRKHWVVGMGVLALVGCVAGMDSGDGGASRGPGPLPQLAGGYSVGEIQAGLAKGARSFSATSYRVVGREDTPDIRWQMHLKALATPIEAPRVDWNVGTNAPVRTTPTTYGVGWTTSSNKDMLAFAVDAKNVPTNGNGSRSPGISSGANGCTSTGCKAGTLFVLTDLYNTTPTVLYYNNAASNESYALNGLYFNFDSANPRLYSLDQSGHLFCNSTTSWTGTSVPTSATSLGSANCAGYGGSGVTAGLSGTVTWSGPYPVFNSSGGIDRAYWCNDSGGCTCAIGAGATTGAGTTCTGWPKTGISTKIMGPPAVYNVDASHFVVFVGDEGGNFYRIYDNAGTLTVSSSVLCGSGTCDATYAVHGAPVVDFVNNLVYVAAGGKLFAYPAAATGTWGSTSSVSLPASGGWSAPIDGWPSYDGSGYVYVTANNTLYKVAVNSTGITGTVYSTALYNQVTATVTIDNAVSVAAQSEPLGYPLVYYSSVFVNTGKGGTSSNSASGAIEQYGCETSASTPVLTQKTTGGPYGILATTGEVLDFATGNLNFGYENGVVSTSDDGYGGVVQYNANGSPPTTNWACPSPYTASSTAACGSYGCALASGSCTSDANCSSPTSRCNTNTGKCVACLFNSDCTTGSVCANQGSNPAYTCVTGANCTVTSDCSTQTTKKKCEMTSTSPYYNTCQQCTTGDTSACTGSTAVCEQTTSDANYDTCVQCDATHTTACTGSTPTCDTTSTDATFDKCVACSPNNDTNTAGNHCASTTPICTTSSTCVQCDSANKSQCKNSACMVDNYCQCSQTSDCPYGAKCNKTTGECNG